MQINWKLLFYLFHVNTSHCGRKVFVRRSEWEEMRASSNSNDWTQVQIIGVLKNSWRLIEFARQSNTFPKEMLFFIFYHFFPFLFVVVVPQSVLYTSKHGKWMFLLYFNIYRHHLFVLQPEICRSMVSFLVRTRNERYGHTWAYPHSIW